MLGTFELLSDRELLEEEMENLESLLETARREAVYAHFANRFLNQPDEQSGGVRETIGNYLQYFLTPEVAEVFCAEESTFDFAAIDTGKIILTTMPQKFQTERRYVNTFLKLLYYSHALRRFDQTKADRAKNNVLILWADEAQRFMTASEDGTSDYNCVDVIREAGATIVAAAAAAAVQAADFLGKKRVVKRSCGFSAGKRNVNYSETEEHKIKPHKLRNLRDHECVLVHCERGFRRITLPPLKPDGGIAKWYSRWRRISYIKLPFPDTLWRTYEIPLTALGRKHKPTNL